jgi:hypothetical protein
VFQKTLCFLTDTVAFAAAAAAAVLTDEWASVSEEDKAALLALVKQ